MSQGYENEAGRSRARQSRRRPSAADGQTVRRTGDAAFRGTVREHAGREAVYARPAAAEASAGAAPRRATPPDAGRRHAGIGRSREDEGIQLWNELASRAEGRNSAGRTAAAAAAAGPGNGAAGTESTGVKRSSAGRSAGASGNTGAVASAGVRNTGAGSAGVRETTAGRSTGVSGASGARSAGARGSGAAETAGFRESAGGSGRGNGGSGNGSGGGNGGTGNGDSGSGRNRRTGRRQKDMSPEAKRRRRIIKFIIAECFALVFIFSYAFVARRWSLVQRDETFSVQSVKNEELADETLEKMEGYWTVAVFGVDSRGSNTGKGANADVNMIFNINRDTGEIRIVSVFRDSYLNIDDKGSYNKINQAYFVGGASQAVKALNKNLDLDIQEYVTFNWKAVAEAINILGGIDMEISKAEFSYINSFITETQKVTGIPTTQLKHAGMNHLDGVQAVAYGRLRLMDTDFARTERQRKVIEAAFAKAKNADFSVLNNIIVTVAPLVSTNIDTMDLVQMAQNISKYHIGETGGFPFARGDANMGRKGACVVPTTLESNVVELHNFLFDDEDYTTTDQVKQISAKIISDTGLSKEGEFVYHADTSGGAVYKPTTAKETEETSEILETDEDGNPIESSEAETDEDGNPIKSSEAETDENGNPVKTSEAETDEDGNPIKNSGAGSEEYETDEFGMIIPTQGGSKKPTSETEKEETSGSGSHSGNSHSGRPGSTESSRPGTGETARPSGTAEESTEASRAPIVNSPTRPEETTVNWSGPGGDIRDQADAPSSTGDGVILPPTSAAAETSPQEPIAPLS